MHRKLGETYRELTLEALVMGVLIFCSAFTGMMFAAESLSDNHKIIYLITGFGVIRLFYILYKMFKLTPYDT